ncbi:F0F1 ATP synthase subunit delta [Falsiroseomonas sp.]|uniref:F0F1 ATP synthase subunit delta n=1 Tax=Falsiroseomonas sp. TaxID=2870721 RepID=UPI0027362BB5|nr:F0F1 ATP synthase subunit delta [Falsiroseomonas sp.]MDP3414761.1 F0F1 ATP synthase subunit delta [Falsiroseomonas sp.]
MQIDWLTVTAQIFNFLILVWLLQRFLYRPIIQAMARREERIESRLAEAKAARAEIEAEAARLQERQRALEANREEALDEARREATALRARLEKDIQEDMEAKRTTWHAHLDDEREAFAARLRQRAGHQVIDIVGRVLRDYVGSDLAGQVAGTFADRLSALDTAERDKLTRAAARAGGQARVESGIALKPGARSQVTRAIHECVGRDIDVGYHEDADLLLGMRLTIGEQTVEWSAARFLHRLETTLDEVIEGSGRHRPGGAPATG